MLAKTFQWKIILKLSSFIVTSTLPNGLSKVKHSIHNKSLKIINSNTNFLRHFSHPSVSVHTGKTQSLNIFIQRCQISRLAYNTNQDGGLFQLIILLSRVNHERILLRSVVKSLLSVSWEITEIEVGTSHSGASPGGGGPASGSLLPAMVKDCRGKETWQLHFLLARQWKPN